MSNRYGFGWRKVRQVFCKTSGHCFYCGIKLPPDTDYIENGIVYSSTRNWDIDHLVPLSRGGSNHNDNLVPSCKPCNREKGTQTYTEYVKVQNETN